MGCLLFPLFVGAMTTAFRKRFPAKWRIDILNVILWGSGAMLLVDHVLNGEIVPWFPFLTAMASPDGLAVVAREVLLVGGPMTLAAVAVWLGIVLFLNISERRAASKATA